jgi:hypothetical protein
MSCGDESLVTDPLLSTFIMSRETALAVTCPWKTVRRSSACLLQQKQHAHDDVFACSRLFASSARMKLSRHNPTVLSRNAMGRSCAACIYSHNELASAPPRDAELELDTDTPNGWSDILSDRRLCKPGVLARIEEPPSLQIDRSPGRFVVQLI